MTPKQMLFVKEYLVDLNATAAARRAGYSEKTAKSIGQENLTKPDIAAAIAEATKKNLDGLDVTTERVLKELARIAFADIRPMFDEDGHLRPMLDLDEDTVRMIGSVEVTKERSYKRGEDDVITEYITKVRPWDKLGALNTLAKHLRLTTESRVEHTADVTLIELLTGEKPK